MFSARQFSCGVSVGKWASIFRLATSRTFSSPVRLNLQSHNKTMTLRRMPQKDIELPLMVTSQFTPDILDLREERESRRAWSLVKSRLALPLRL